MMDNVKRINLLSKLSVVVAALLGFGAGAAAYAAFSAQADGSAADAPAGTSGELDSPISTFVVLGNSTTSATALAELKREDSGIRDVWVKDEVSFDPPGLPANAVLLVDAVWLEALPASDIQRMVGLLRTSWSDAEGLSVVVLGGTDPSGLLGDIVKNAGTTTKQEGATGPLYSAVREDPATGMNRLEVPGDAARAESVRSGLIVVLRWASGGTAFD